MSEKLVADGFGDVDRAARPETFVKYLDTVTGIEAAQAYKRRSYDLLHLRPAHHVLDAAGRERMFARWPGWSALLGERLESIIARS